MKKSTLLLLAIGTLFSLHGQHKDFRYALQLHNQRSGPIAPSGLMISAAQANPSAGGIIFGEFTAPANSFNDLPGIWGVNAVDDYWGVGVRGQGGFIGVEGQVYGTSDKIYYGLTGIATSPNGLSYGLAAEASSNAGTSYGVFAEAFTSTGTSYGVYGTTTGAGNFGVYGLNPIAGGFAGFFEGQVGASLIAGNIQPGNYLSGVNIAVSGTPVNFAGIGVRYLENTDEGASVLFAPDGTGVSIGDAAGGLYYPINASAFNISSDRRVKSDITTISGRRAAPYMEQLRRIESATFWYKQEDRRKRSVPHIGVIAQSLPPELQTELSEKASGGIKRLGVSLSDWLGLVTIGVKENDRRLQEVEAENEALRTEVEELKTMVRQLLAEPELRQGEGSYLFPLEKPAELRQNQPNPFRQNTDIHYFIPNEVQDARLQITSVEGQLIGTIRIQEAGQGKVTIQANSYPAGTYFYSLILDGQVVSTKRMILKD